MLLCVLGFYVQIVSLCMLIMLVMKLLYDIWSELNETYQKADGSVVFNIHQKINSLTQSGLNVFEYYSKLDSFCNEFDGPVNLAECTCEASAQFNNDSNLMKLMQFLSGFDDTFSHVKSHILLMEPLPTVKIVFTIVSREESHQKGGSIGQNSTNPQASAFAGKFNVQEKTSFMVIQIYHANTVVGKGIPLRDVTSSLGILRTLSLEIIIKILIDLFMVMSLLLLILLKLLCPI